MNKRTLKSARSPAYFDAGNVTILLKVKFEELDHLGELDFVASPHDVEAHGLDIYNRAVAGEFGPVSPYSPAA